MAGITSNGKWWLGNSSPFVSSQVNKFEISMKERSGEQYDHPMRKIFDGMCTYPVDCGSGGVESRDGNNIPTFARETGTGDLRRSESHDETESMSDDCSSVFSSTSSIAADDMSVGSTFTVEVKSFEDSNSVPPVGDLLAFSGETDSQRTESTQSSRRGRTVHALDPIPFATMQDGTSMQRQKNARATESRDDFNPTMGDGGKKTKDVELSLKTHSVSLMVTTATRGKYHRSVADKLTKVGEGHLVKNEYDKALDAFQRAQSIYSVKLGDDAMEAIHTRLRIARVHYANGKHEEALDAFQFARQMTSDTVTDDKNKVQVAEIWKQMSMVHRAKGQPAEALKEMKHSLRAYKAVYGEVHPSVANVAADIAALYKSMGNRPKAIAINSQVLKIQLELYGKVHPDVADTLYELAVLHDESGDVEKSMKINKKAYVIYNTTLGGFNPSIANVLSHFGHLYHKLGKTAKAFKAYGRALHIRKETLGRRHSSVADSLMDIGNLLRSQKQTKQAMQCMTEAMNIYKSCYGEEDVAVSDVMNVIGMIHYDEGDSDNAIRMYSQVLQIRTRALGEKHPSVANVLNNIGTVYSKTKAYDEAMHAYSTALKIYEKTTGKNHVKYAVTLVNIGTIMKNKGENDKAEKVFERAIDICRNKVNLNDEHPVVQKAVKSLEAMKASRRSPEVKNAMFPN